ncbi:MAG: hypothetical protein F4Y00_07780 [Bacteroidetes bacterium SB0662_bin_6]|nr:hypothetical protein [Gammaproteobacteria bacterium]MYE04853.1 hypothetical protein [Bacteroidetes bacterium SB0662_bin_6]
MRRKIDAVPERLDPSVLERVFLTAHLHEQIDTPASTVFLRVSNASPSRTAGSLDLPDNGVAALALSFRYSHFRTILQVIDMF